jgi:ERCC4-related helicase
MRTFDIKVGLGVPAFAQEFREGTVNVLVATCIGEEGLDIPEVNTIACFCHNTTV